MTTGIVFDIKKFALHDGHGIRVTVFLKGCPLRCWWCHNPESQSPQPEILYRPKFCLHCETCVYSCEQGAITWDGGIPTTNREKCNLCGRCVESCVTGAREIVGRAMTVTEVMGQIERDIPFFDESGGGVTFSGGEPLLQKDFLLELLLACKAKDLHTALDTCGYATPETIAAVAPYVDLFLYDLKHIDETKHRHYTGASNTFILENLRRLAESGRRVVIRIPLIPGVNDDETTIRQMGEWIATLPPIEGVDILPYHLFGMDKYARLEKVNPMPETQPPSEAQIQEIVRQLQEYRLAVKIGG